jgi:sensor histidine kinase YesM
MQNLPFVFSNRLPVRLSRHLAFWVVMYLGQASVLSLLPRFIFGLGDNTLTEYFLVPILYLPAQLLLVYSLLYFVIPRFILKYRYRQALLWTLALVLLSSAMAALMYAALFDTVRAHFYVFRNMPFERAPMIDNIPYGFASGLRAVLNVAGFAAAIKLMKYWYEKEYRNTVLQREKLDAELQSLKAQLHPHFLFNTLNNIYSITENTSLLGSDMILRLSELLRYMLYECNRPFVTLSQECKMIEDYIALEKMRYRQLDCSVQLPDATEQAFIAPLLLLPLVENCFKHGTSQVLRQPWIKIQVELKTNILVVKLINGKPASKTPAGLTDGIGLTNLKKRLELLYPGKHELSILAEEDVYIVNCKIDLQNEQQSHG